MTSAFPGPYAPDQPEMQAFMKPNSPSPDGAASQGGSGATAFGGGAGYTLDGPAKKGQGEAAKPSKRDFGMFWREASDEEKDLVVQNVSEPLEAQGMSLQGAVANTLKQGGPHAMAAAQRWGIDLNNFADMLNPQQAQQQPGPSGNTPKAFKSDEAYNESRALTSKNIQDDRKKQRGIDQRRAMGGFLMELGINILGSQSKTGGGAIGEGLKTTFVERRERGMQDEDRRLAKAEADRQKGRQERADEMSEETHRRQGLEKITGKDGTVYFVNPKAGRLEDEKGNPIKEPTSQDISEAQRQTTNRAVVRQKDALVADIIDALEKGQYDEEAQTKFDNGELTQDEIDDLAWGRMTQSGFPSWAIDEARSNAGASGGGEIDYSALPPE